MRRYSSGTNIRQTYVTKGNQSQGDTAEEEEEEEQKVKTTLSLS